MQPEQVSGFAEGMDFSRAKSQLPLAAFFWLISASFYEFWQAGSPVESTLLPPLAMGERVLLAPYLMLEQLGFWLWPMAREPLTFTLVPSAILREGLFYWLILVLVIRFSWRLRRIEPWIFFGIVISLVALIPFSGVVPGWLQPFSFTPLIGCGVGMSMLFATLMIRGAQSWGQPAEKQNVRSQMHQHLWRLVGLLVVIWTGAMTLNLINVAGRTWEARIAAQHTERPDVYVAVEIARQLGVAGQSAKAEALILRCGQAAPWYAEIPVVKAELLLAQDETAAARVHLEKAMVLNPGHQHAAELLNAVQ
ncbi:tetratricopeptide repeat protein [Cerasicoccus arenae]|uniref:Tetratricopeptide repeat protein n=1 Tax=Cerasicoccus arenae TaxID=424488 RepID=A0A8J3DJG3_9BACT|nr:hypothetical protein [Cerasicoccus arenae]MBK1857234.1 hypothetical protein [Cerasicoccus arenae]GHC00169.1 hypothetical protein GCM10007047_15540 [Cerasicoccus arenae]